MPLRPIKNGVAAALIIILAAICGDLTSNVIIGIVDDTVPVQGRILALAVIFILFLLTLRFLVERKNK